MINILIIFSNLVLNTIFGTGIAIYYNRTGDGNGAKVQSFLSIDSDKFTKIN